MFKSIFSPFGEGGAFFYKDIKQNGAGRLCLKDESAQYFKNTILIDKLILYLNLIGLFYTIGCATTRL